MRVRKTESRESDRVKQAHNNLQIGTNRNQIDANSISRKREKIRGTIISIKLQAAQKVV